MKLSVRGVTKVFKTRDKSSKSMTALRGASFDIEEGEFCAIVGESGSGKSTLSRIIAGVIPATDGTVFFDGNEAETPQSIGRKELYKKIQLVLQDAKSALDPHFTIYKCIAEPIRNLTGASKKEERERVLKLIRRMELPEEILKRKPHELSGGQQKRVCIARALAAKPEILIFDEAISGLDVILRKSILDLLKDIHKSSGCTVLFITHDMDVALYMASRIIVMKDGEILEDTHCCGSADCLKHPYSKLLASSMMPKTG